MTVANILLLINLTTTPWSSDDFDTLKSANIRCKERYKTKVSKFVKKEDRHYNVICGDNSVVLDEKDLYK